MTLHKTAAADTHVRPEGVVEALVATWDVDRVKDRIRPGAFAASLARWRTSGKRIPLVFAHETRNPSMIIGSFDPHASRETNAGLLLSGKLNIDNSAAAHDVYDLLADGSINDWSFGYQVERRQKMADGINELIQLDLLEAGPCVAGANPLARTIAIKGLEPDAREPRKPSHVELETRLRAAGIIGPTFTTRDLHALAEDEHDVLLEALMRRRNGDQDHGKATKSGTAGQTTIASFKVD
jgi:HK97 family phage prohead protease